MNREFNGRGIMKELSPKYLRAKELERRRRVRDEAKTRAYLNGKMLVNVPTKGDK